MNEVVDFPGSRIGLKPADTNEATVQTVAT